MTDHHEDVDKLDGVRKKLLKFQLDVSSLFIEMLAEIKGERYSRVDQCDIGWCFREIRNICDEIRKEAKARQDLVGKLLAFRMIEDIMNDPDALGRDDSLRVKGRFATGTPENRQQAALPKHGTPEYAQLCAYLGISNQDVIDSRVVQFSFTKLGDYVSTLMEQGKQIPDGLTKTYPLYSTTFRTRKRN